MKRLLALLLILPALGLAQSRFGHGGSGTSVSAMLPIIADSTDWTAGSHVNAIKPKGGKSIEADSAKFGYLNVTGDTQLDGNLTMNTVASEQVKLGTGSNAAPELSSAGDTNTGIRFPGGDKIQFVQNGLNSHTFRPSQYTLTASDGDTLSIHDNGSYTVFLSKNSQVHQSAAGYYVWDGTNLFPYQTDSKYLGNQLSNRIWQGIFLSDFVYLGGKGQTATQYISKENTIAGADSSMMFRIGSDGNPYMRWAAADADSARLHVRSDSTEFYSKNALVLDAPAVLVGGSNVGVSKIDTVFTATFVPRWLKITSGSKSWYSPVYADTTGKW